MTIEKETMNTKTETGAGKAGFPAEWLKAESREAWRAWLDKNNNRQTEVWLRIKKAGAALRGV